MHWDKGETQNQLKGCYNVNSLFNISISIVRANKMSPVGCCYPIIFGHFVNLSQAFIIIHNACAIRRMKVEYTSKSTQPLSTHHPSIYTPIYPASILVLMILSAVALSLVRIKLYCKFKYTYFKASGYL